MNVVFSYGVAEPSISHLGRALKAWYESHCFMAHGAQKEPANSGCMMLSYGVQRWRCAAEAHGDAQG